MKYATILALAASAQAAVHIVEVGEDGQKFTPQTLKASTGDTVIFELYPSHNVVEGNFNSPCEPSDDGFYSGPFSDTDNGKKRFVVNVTTTNAIYYYCAVQKHCQNGMVGGINVPSDGDNTIGAYADKAKNVEQSKTPDKLRGGQLEEDEQLASLTSGGVASETGASASGSASGPGSGSPSATSATTTPAASGSPTASGSGAAQSTGAAADVVALGQLNGAVAMALGFAAWFL